VGQELWIHGGRDETGDEKKEKRTSEAGKGGENGGRDGEKQKSKAVNLAVVRIIGWSS
jgi:hypothetical protein